MSPSLSEADLSRLMNALEPYLISNSLRVLTILLVVLTSALLLLVTISICVIKCYFNKMASNESDFNFDRQILKFVLFVFFCIKLNWIDLNNKFILVRLFVIAPQWIWTISTRMEPRLITSKSITICWFTANRFLISLINLKRPLNIRMTNPTVEVLYSEEDER